MNLTAPFPTNDDFKQSHSRCVSLRGRVKQYYTEGRFHNCSELLRCWKELSGSLSGSELDGCTTVESNSTIAGESENRELASDPLLHCANVWREFEGFRKLESEGPLFWARRTEALADWNKQLPPDLEQRAKRAFPDIAKDFPAL